MELFYQKAAERWLETLPLGNGHQGAMLFGGETGQYELTENTFWSGRPRHQDIPPQAKAAMDKTRELLRSGKANEAQKTFEEGYCSDAAAFGTQLPLGTLRIAIAQKATQATRRLNLMQGVAHEQLLFSSAILRTSFISHPAKLLCVRMASQDKLPSKMPPIDISLTAERVTSLTVTKSGMTLWCEARENLHSDASCGTNAFCALETNTDGEAIALPDSLRITGATYLELYFAAKTNFECENPDVVCAERLQNTTRGFDVLLAEHQSDFESHMEKCSLSLHSNTPSSCAVATSVAANIPTALPTDEAVSAYRATGNDLQLEETLFQMGRYLLLITSREDSLVPATLQGILNDNLACRMGWANDLHLDINTQMNYAHAHATGLSGCTLPLYRYIKDKLAMDGAIAAKQLYGAKGWGANTVTNLFGFAPPKANKPRWAMSHTCGGWLSLSIWEHYLYTNDLQFLATYYEVLRGSAAFLLDLLEPHPLTGELVANPSYSPENSFYDGGTLTALCIGSTFDRNIAVSLFSAVIQAAQALHITNDSTVDALREALTNMPPLRKGAHGQLMEWYEDYAEAEPTHRHTSHLLCLHPFQEINCYEGSQALAWAAESLDRRTQDDITVAKVCWCAAQTVSQYAMLHNAEKAAHFHRLSARTLLAPNLLMPHGGDGIYELDGNTGYTASIVDMLLQSGKDWIDLLPALPPYWHSGSVGVLTAKGNISVSIEWEENTLKSVTLCAASACTRSILYHGAKQRIAFEKGIPVILTAINAFASSKNRLNKF